MPQRHIPVFGDSTDLPDGFVYCGRCPAIFNQLAWATEVCPGEEEAMRERPKPEPDDDDDKE